MADLVGTFIDDDGLRLAAERRTYFDPNIGLVKQNYLENRPRYQGIGNYNVEELVYRVQRGGQDAASAIVSIR